GEWHGDRPIVFGDYNWDSALLLTRIAQFVVEEGYGYETDSVPGETIPLFQAQIDDEIDISMEIGEQQIAPYGPALEDGEVVQLGQSMDNVVQGWYVPTYVIEGDEERGIEPMAPDLAHIDDLPEYWEVFEDPEDSEKGRIYDGVPGWEGERVQEVKFYYYGLDEHYNRFLPGSGAALDTSLVTAYERGEPWLGYMWEPTWISGQLDITLLEEPNEYSDECWDEIQDAALEGRATEMACEWPVLSTDIVASPDFVDEAPDIAQFLDQFNTDATHISASLAYMAENEVTHNEAALWFLDEYDELWPQWVPEDVAERVQDALDN
ncbi:MAG: glycine betaine ABC transporter substrate-binding protein, partial [Thermomicrobiaceae bacterium]